jgi:hypothetical protein
MIRDELLESDRFLSLPDNTARMCFVVILLNADDRGNLEASPGQLVRMWRDFGIDSNAKAASIAQSLADQDLIRMYEADQKQYAHVPRFRQRLRHLKHACPASPWCDRQENQSGAQKNDGRTADERQTDDGRASAEEKGSEGKRSEVKGREELLLTTVPVVAGCPHKQIIELYHQHLPMGRRVNVDLWNGARAKHLQARWKEKPNRQTLTWWQRFFEHCAESEFLTGKVQPKPGHSPFEVSLDWIVKPDNFVKIIEGAYNRG